MSKPASRKRKKNASEKDVSNGQLSLHKFFTKKLQDEKESPLFSTVTKSSLTKHSPVKLTKQNCTKSPMLEGSSCKSFKENESGDVAITSVDCIESGRPQLRSEQVRCKKKRQPTNEEVSPNSPPPKMMKTISILTSDDSQAVVPNHEDNGLCAPRSNEEDEKLQTGGGIEQLDRSPSSACSFGFEVDKTGNHPTVLLGLDQHTASTLGMEQESTRKLGMEQETTGELGMEQETIGKFEMEQETKRKCGMEQVAATTLEMELKTAEMPEMMAKVGQNYCSVTEQHKETITSNESSVKTPSRSRSTPKKAIETAVKATTFLFSSPTSRSSMAVSSAPLLGSSVKRQLLHALEKEDALPEQMSMDEGGSQPAEITQADIDPNLELFGEEFENFDELFASMDSRDTFGCSNTDQEEEQNLEPYNLFIVTSVTDDAEKRAKILLLSEKKAITPGSRQCVLKGDWYFFNVVPGDEIRLVDPVHGADGVLTVDNEHESYVILNPDWLIGATTVANAVTCPRKAVLSEVFKGGLQKQGGGQEVMVMGSLLHSVFEQVLKTAHSRERSVTVKYVQAVMKKTVLSHSSLESLYAIGVSEVEALKRISEYSSSVVDWVSKYLHPHPQPGKGDIDFKRPVSNLLSEGESSCLCVSNVVDIEENIWAPRYGLKGKIDATVEVKIHRVPRSSVQHTTTPSVEVECSRIPFELKTGKMWTKLGSAEHRAQIILYTLMMEERYGVEVTGGLLHYLKAQHMQGVPAFPSEKRALLMLRNQVAHNLSNGNSTTLPPEMLGLERICKRCSHLSQCCMYHNVIEGGCARSSKIEETFISAVGHLGEDDLEFFGKWFRLIDKEVQFSWRRRPISDIWTQDVGERVLAGVCVLGLRPTSHTSLPEGRVLQVLHTTEGETSSVIPVETMTVGERVVVSGVDGCSWAIGTGNIREVSEKSITVLMDRILPATKLYRIDILNSTSCNNMWVTVANLMLPGERESRLRDLLIRFKEPSFHPVSPDAELSTLGGQLSSLNTEQQRAIKKCIAATDYLLIQGMPGTGKTTTLAALIKVLVSRGHTVLFTSFTNSAVDNLLLKLEDVDYIRVSSTTSTVHPNVHKHTTSVIGRQCQTVDKLGLMYENAPVVGVTCLGVHHPIFSKRHFDYCIVDEATQVTFPTILGPLLLADKFILVGDHYQLPPLVQDKEAKSEGLGTSLFKMLCDTHPKALVQLTQQFRMNNDIMALSNSLVYDNKLVAGSNDVAMATLDIPLWSEVMATEEVDGTYSDGWIWKVLDPKQAVVFVDTDKMGAEESASSYGDKWNNRESGLVASLVHRLTSCGVSPESIGVITPYRQQQKAIVEVLRGLSSSSKSSFAVTGKSTVSGDGDKMAVSTGTQRSYSYVMESHFENGLPVAGSQFEIDPLVVGSKFESNSIVSGSNFETAASLTKFHSESNTLHTGSQSGYVPSVTDSHSKLASFHTELESSDNCIPQPSLTDEGEGTEQNHCFLDFERIEVNTVDKYQGRDKNCIIVSFVRSNSQQQVGKLLEDTSRVNVALTRAKHKLILVGSKSTLSGSPFLSDLLSVLAGRDWIIRPRAE